MLLNWGITVKFAALVKAEGNFELCANTVIAKDSLELGLVSVKHLNQIGAQVSRDELHQFVVQAMTVDWQSHLVLNMLMLLPFFAKHDNSMVVRLILKHFFDLSLLNCFDKVLVIFINLFL